MLLDEVEPPFDFATSITLGAYRLLANEQRLKFPAVPVSELVAALPEAPQVV